MSMFPMTNILHFYLFFFFYKWAVWIKLDSTAMEEEMTVQ